MTFLDLLRQARQHSAEREMLRVGRTSYSYRAFYESVDAVASRLPDGGKRVAVVLGDDLETYASILAIWCTGNTYVPLDSRLSETMQQRLLSSVQPDIVLSSTEFEAPVELLRTDHLTAGETVHSLPFKANNVAYILTTSGTTGEPKHIPVTYENLDCFVDSFLTLDTALSDEDVFLQMSELRFDMSIISFLVPWCIGASVHAISMRSTRYLEAYRQLEQNKITVFVTAPSTVQLLAPHFDEINLPHLRYTFFGAEVLRTSLATRWKQCAPNGEIFNLYGPSEAGIFVTAHHWIEDSSGDEVPIGRPVKHAQTRIVQGELWVSGKQVFPGYLEDKLNTNAFQQKDGVRWYKTGDLVAFDEQGNLMFRGRRDRQAKVSGVRVELAAVEAAAKELGVEAVALLSTGEHGFDEVVLFTVNAPDHFEKMLRPVLPHGALPGRFIDLAEWPLKQGENKIDRDMLQYSLDDLTRLTVYHLFALLDEMSGSSAVEYVAGDGFSAVHSSVVWPNAVYRVDPKAADLALTAERIRGKELPNYLMLDAAQAHECESDLAEAGFIPVDEWPCLYMEPTAVDMEPALSNAVEINHIDNEEGIALWTKVASGRATQMDPAIFQHLFRAGAQFYLAMEAGDAIGAAMWWMRGGVAGIYHVHTYPEHRKKGIGTALFKHCQQVAVRAGARLIVAQATKSGFGPWVKSGMNAQGSLYLFRLALPDESG